MRFRGHNIRLSAVTMLVACFQRFRVRHFCVDEHESFR